jgi:hypothetical protein
VEPDSIAEPMKFNYFKFHQTASWNFSGFLYLGGGIHFDIYENIRDEKLDTANEVFTHHYEYSVAHDFNPEHYGLNALVQTSFLTRAITSSMHRRDGLPMSIGATILSFHPQNKTAPCFLQSYASLKL